MILLARVDTFRGGMGQQFCITKKKNNFQLFQKAEQKFMFSFGGFWNWCVNLGEKLDSDNIMVWGGRLCLFFNNHITVHNLLGDDRILIIVTKIYVENEFSF